MSKTVKLLASILLTTAFAAPPVMGMRAIAHRDTVHQALEILKTGDEKQRWIYGFFAYHASKNGTSPQATIAEMGPAPDDFLDTVIGGWWIGYRYFVELKGVSYIGFAGLSSHFTAAFRPGKFGDRYSGYSYRIAPDDGFFGMNTIMKTLLYNQEIRSGSYENARGLVFGLKDIFQIVSQDWLGLVNDIYNGEKGGKWGLPGTDDVLHDYQTQTASSDHSVNGQFKNSSWRIPSTNWKDYQDTYFSPGANAGQFWYNQFTHHSTFDNINEAQLRQLGYTMHWVADGSTPQHVWSTSDHNHVSFETYIDAFLTEKKFKADSAKVFSVIDEFQNSSMTTYRQQFSKMSDLDADKATVGAIDPNNISAEGIRIKDIRINGKFDYTYVSIGDILRFLAEQAVKREQVLADDSEETFSKNANESLTLAVAGAMMVLQKAAGDLYKAKQYKRILSSVNAKAEIYGYGTFEVAGITYNQIR